ncbi:MAG: hypothetical protein JSV86_05600 [Gemmatimonadota bacterium]|nr:MAG: hypothetical protein JSV86_05600 [Gemmatimonadota bacterium]
MAKKKSGYTKKAPSRSESTGKTKQLKGQERVTGARMGRTVRKNGCQHGTSY